MVDQEGEKALKLLNWLYLDGDLTHSKHPLKVIFSFQICCMKTHHLLLACLLFMAACNQSQPAQDQPTTSVEPTLATQPAEAPPAPAAAPAALTSAVMYTGFFEAADYDEKKSISLRNKITIAIESLENGVVKGFSVVAGNSRPFEGTYTESGNTVSATASEPGDDKYDGVFTFQLQRNGETLTGTWKANNSKLGVTKRTYKLEKRVFQYDPNLDLSEGEIPYTELYGTYKEIDAGEGAEFITEDAVKFNASKVLLRKEDVENMHKGDLEVTRNAIYARHGYSFKNRRMRYLFDSLVDWYMPVSTNITGQFTELERKNIDLLKRYEQHAVAYYDSFGR